MTMRETPSPSCRAIERPPVVAVAGSGELGSGAGGGGGTGGGAATTPVVAVSPAVDARAIAAPFTGLPDGNRRAPPPPPLPYGNRRVQPAVSDRDGSTGTGLVSTTLASIGFGAIVLSMGFDSIGLVPNVRGSLGFGSDGFISAAFVAVALGSIGLASIAGTREASAS